MSEQQPSPEAPAGQVPDLPDGQVSEARVGQMPEVPAGLVPDLPDEVESSVGGEPLSPERERALARAAVVAALVALRQVAAAREADSEAPQRRFAAPARAVRRPVRGGWKHRF